MLVPEEFRLAAKKGAVLLDEEMPGWAQRIDVYSLRMSSSCGCILGQLTGDYWRGTRQLHLLTMAAVEHGFQLITGGVTDVPAMDWIRLKQAWVDEIELRR